MSMRYFCRTDQRRDSVRQTPGLNGIDFVEVDAAQTTLTIAFLKPDGLAALATNAAKSLRVEGGERVRGVRIVSVTASGSALTATVDRRGDFSRYVLLLRRDEASLDPPDGFDPLLASVGFSFKAACDSDFDCQAARDCPPDALDEPAIDYLAKDYSSFRQQMLDRLTLLAPRWTERNPADLGVTLVELLAYVGDQLSYWQDAVATEAYLGAARKRISVRRHARLVDYRMHDGCNARVWVQIRVSATGVAVPARTALWTRTPGTPARIAPGSSAADQIAASQAASFETLRDAMLHAPHNRIAFHTWGEADCCLPRGATSATLVDGATPGQRLRLQPGDVLLLAETKSGGDADTPALARGQAARLTRVRPGAGAAPLVDPVTLQPIVEIEWHAEDALAFPINVSGQPGGAGVALGNLVLAQHAKAASEQLRCDHAWRYRPKLSAGPLTQAGPDPDAEETPGDAASLRSAAAALRGDFAEVEPLIRLEEGGHVWEARRDLLASGPEDRHFVAEIDDDGVAQLRFGDGVQGRRPALGDLFVARYRVGNGAAGNLGADSLFHVLHLDPAVTGVRNPLPAAGGAEPESIEDVRVRAPSAFRVQERAVTAEDYAAAAERSPRVKRAAATLRWTGSWFTAFVTIEPRGAQQLDDTFKKAMHRHLQRYRLAGHDLEIDGPRYVPLELALDVCVQADYFRARVRTGLLEALGSRRLRAGGAGLFHPERWTFGQSVYLSRIVTAALAVAGVASVNVATFQRQRRPDPAPLREGKLAIDRLEIAQLANDPNFPERGVLRLDLTGGK